MEIYLSEQVIKFYKSIKNSFAKITEKTWMVESLREQGSGDLSGEWHQADKVQQRGQKY